MGVPSAARTCDLLLRRPYRAWASPASSLLGALVGCLDRKGIREAVTYLPGSRYWPLQYVETGIFLALALVLVGSCSWQLGRRRT